MEWYTCSSTLHTNKAKQKKWITEMASMQSEKYLEQNNNTKYVDMLHQHKLRSASTD